ncbi:MAG: peptidoglycan D,D-transpeptidase FtsI family protein [Eggerthellaceae bacterium]
MFLFALFALAALCLLGRLVYLQVIAADLLAQDALNSRSSTVQVTPRRGTIYDRNGVVLAISVDAVTVYANPTEITDAAQAATQIASVLGGKAEDYQEKLTQNTTFVYVKRQADAAKAEALKALSLKGIYFQDDTRREYPCGQVGGQVVGFCSVDGKGVAGLELQYDDLLAGNSGQVRQEYDKYGVPIPGTVADEEDLVDGQDIVVSIDVVMQEAMENILEDYTQRLGVDTGAVLMDGKTGEIYAAASTPLFNPADTSVVKKGSTVLKPLTKSFEPGSVFKAVTSLRLLETKSMDVDDKIYCPEEIEADGYKVTDSHERKAQKMTLRKIIAESSNIGVSLATEKKMGFGNLNEAITQYGLTESTGVDFPGEPDPIVPDFDQWSRIQGYNISFGQGITQTPLQMVRFYSAFTNNGSVCTPHFLVSKPQSGETLEYDTKKAVSGKKVLKNQISLLESVVEEGTGTPAQISGYRVAGKTGTAEVASDTGGYKKGIYNISFIGFLPQSTSNLVCYTGAYELDAEGNVSPMFKDIMQEAIDRYSIASK